MKKDKAYVSREIAQELHLSSKVLKNMFSLGSILEQQNWNGGMGSQEVLLLGGLVGTDVKVDGMDVIDNTLPLGEELRYTLNREKVAYAKVFGTMAEVYDFKSDKSKIIYFREINPKKDLTIKFN